MSLPFTRIALTLMICGIVSSAVVQPADAYTPESPEVRAMVEKGLKYLEKHAASASEHRLGTLALCGMALHKSGRPESNPVIQAAIKECQKRVKSEDFKKRIYSSGVYADMLAAIFLMDLANAQYAPEINEYLKFVVDVQTAGGAWTYNGSNTGDTSQTQYGVLALWTAEQAGYKVSPNVSVKAINWIIRVQDPSGGWPYMGQDNGTYQRVPQGETKLSLTAASLGSAYILSDRLGYKSAAKKQDKKVGELPPQFKLIRDEKEVVGGGGPVAGVDPRALGLCVNDGKTWLDRNVKFPGSSDFNNYYMYALERCMGFRELAEGVEDPEPKWYNDGVDYLKTKVQADGSFTENSSHHGPEVSTAFAVLFLTRSTKKAIAKAVIRKGSLKGGRGLPGDTSNMKMKNGRVVAAPPAKSFEDLMSMLEDPGDEDAQLIASFPELVQVEGDPAAYAKHVAKLRQMANHESYAVRLIAIRTLARARDLDNVPTLIYGLTDPDWRVIKEARDGLRFVSRKIDGFRLRESSTGIERETIIQQWKEWYRQIRPNAPRF